MPKPKKLSLSFLQGKSAVKGETGLMQRFHDVHIDTLGQTQEGLLNPGHLCRALGRASGENLFSNPTQKVPDIPSRKKISYPILPCAYPVPSKFFTIQKGRE